MIYEVFIDKVITISAILFWLVVFWSLLKTFKNRRKETVIEDRGYCPCRLSSVGACGVTMVGLGEELECGLDIHLVTCKSEGCNGLGDLIDSAICKHGVPEDQLCNLCEE